MMAKFIDLTGQRFGRLMVISRSPNRKNWRAMWQSCGCLVGEWSKNNPPNKKYKQGDD